MPKSPSYTIAGFGRMIQDRIRTDAYARALEQVVHSESVVLDIGCGTGIFSLVACKLGARKVYSCDVSSATEIAVEAARRNGFDDRMHVFRKSSLELDLEEKVDVIVSDVRGTLPHVPGMVPTIKDARERLLAPGGVLLPRRDRIFAGLVEAPDLYRAILEPWTSGFYGLDLASGKMPVVNSMHQLGAFHYQQLSPESLLWTLDYETVVSPNHQGRATWVSDSYSNAHGIRLWFEAELLDGIGYRAESSRSIYGSPSFLPFEDPLEIRPGDRLEMKIRVDAVADDLIWTWMVALDPRDSEDRERARRIKQSTLASSEGTAEKVRARSRSHRPRRNTLGDAALGALRRFDGEKTIDEIGSWLLETYTEEIGTEEDAGRFAAWLSSRFSR